MLADADEAGVPNLRVEIGDAVLFLEERVADDTFDAIHLFFPDPWRKKKHTKRRFVSATNLDLLARVLKPGGHLLIATDQDFYATTPSRRSPRTRASRPIASTRPAWRPRDGFEAKGSPPVARSPNCVPPCSTTDQPAAQTTPASQALPAPCLPASRRA